MSNYYTPRNQALEPNDPYRATVPDPYLENYLRKAIDAGIIAPKISLDEICTSISVCWLSEMYLNDCLHNGETDFEGNIRRSIGHYLDGIFLISQIYHSVK